MRNFFYRLSSAIARSMYGRNGRDQLNDALMILYLAVWLLSLLLNGIRRVSSVLATISMILAIAVIFRCFSRNLEKRRAENTRFLAWWRPVQNRISSAKQRRMDKEHKYFVCKNCKTLCRVPAGKGKIEITCPKCGGKIIGKS